MVSTDQLVIVPLKLLEPYKDIVIKGPLNLKPSYHGISNWLIDFSMELSALAQSCSFIHLYQISPNF